MDKKTVYIVAELVSAIGLGAAWIFGKIDGSTFTTISLAISGLIYGLYKKYEKEEVEALHDTLLLEHEEVKMELEETQSRNSHLRTINTGLLKQATLLDNELKSMKVQPVEIEVTSETVSVPTETKRTSKKRK